MSDFTTFIAVAASMIATVFDFYWYSRLVVLLVVLLLLQVVLLFQVFLRVLLLVLIVLLLTYIFTVVRASAFIGLSEKTIFELYVTKLTMMHNVSTGSIGLCSWCPQAHRVTISCQNHTTNMSISY